MAIRQQVDAGAAAGILGVVIPSSGLAIVPIWTFPGTGASGEQIARFAAQHRPALELMMVTYAIGVSLWLVFGVALALRLRRELPAGSVAPTCVGAGVIGFATMLLSGFVAFDLVIYRLPGPTEARLLYDLTFGLLAMSGLPTAIATAGYAAAIYRYRVLPPWTAHLAAVTAAAHVALLLSFIVPTGFFSLEGPVIAVVPALLWAWILATALTLPRHRRIPVSAPSIAAQAPA